MGERTPLALLDAPASGRMAVGEAHHQPRRGADRRSRPGSSSPPTGWRPPATATRTRRCSIPSRRSASSSARRWASRFRSARIRCRCARSWEEDGHGEAGDRAAVADRHRLRALRRRAPHADAATAARRGGRRNRTAPDRPRRRARIASAARRWRRCIGVSGDVRAGCRCRACCKAFFGAIQQLNARADPRLPRPLRRRPVRHGLRDELRRAMSASR